MSNAPGERGPRRLLIFDDQWVASDGDAIAGTEASALVFGELCGHFEQAVFVARAATHQPNVLYALPKHVRQISLPPYRSIADLHMRFPWYARDVLRAVRATRRQADVMLLCWPHPLSLLLLLAATFQRDKIPAVLLVRADVRRLAALRFRGRRRSVARAGILLLERLVRWLRPRATVLACGEALRQRYAADFADVRSVATSPVRASQLRDAARRSVPDSAAVFRLVFVGRLEPEKCVADLLQAIAGLRQEGAAFELEVIGDGSERTCLGVLAEELGIQRIVRFAGEIAFGPALLERIAAADALVLCSRTEGLPSVLLEAASVSTAIVASAVGGIPFLLQDGVHALLFDPAQPDALISTLRRAIRDRAALAAMSDSARRVLTPVACETQVRIMRDALRSAC